MRIIRPIAETVLRAYLERRYFTDAFSFKVDNCNKWFVTVCRVERSSSFSEPDDR